MTRRTDQAVWDPELAECGGSYTHKMSLCDVTLRWPIRNPVLFLATGFGFTYLINLALLLACWASGAWIGAYGLAVATVLVFVGSLIKRCIHSPRPDRTAARANGAPKNNGMPSGHSLNTVTLLVWQLLELHENSGDVRLALLHVALLLPVPWSRWYNGDHTAQQVVVSSAAAVLLGVAAFYVRVVGSAQGAFPEEASAPW